MPTTPTEWMVMVMGLGIIMAVLLFYNKKDVYALPGAQPTYESANQITPEKYGHALWMVRELKKIVDEDGGPQNSHEERVVEEAMLLLTLDYEKIK